MKAGYQKLEIIFFIIFSLIATLPFFLVKYVPSLDGPQHLYNSRLIAELLKGNEFIGQYFRFNPVIVGNLSSHFIMAFLMLIFPAWIAEKIFLSFYVIGLALAFRYFIKSVVKTDSLLYLLIFPFAFTSLFMMGYYNFSLAFIPFFLALGYFKRHEMSLGIKETIGLVLFCLLIYLSHAVVFVFFGLIILLQLAFDLGYPLIFRKGSVRELMAVVRRYGILLISAIPAIILWVKYYLFLNTGDRGSPSESFRPIPEVLGELYKLRILVGFHHEQEAGSNLLMFWTLLILVILTFMPLQRFFPRESQAKREFNRDWFKWTFIVIVLMAMAIFFPDRMVTGSMSARLAILFFLGAIAWISLQKFPKMVMFAGLILIMAAFTWHRILIYNYHEKMNREIADLEDAGEFVQPKTILYPVNCSENWLQLHFHCYLGVDKPVIDLGNPQVNGPLPLLWNQTKMPGILLGGLNQQQAGVYWVSGNKYLTPVSSDYIFIWRSQRIEAVEGVTAFVDKIRPFYDTAYKSDNGNALLFRLN